MKSVLLGDRALETWKPGNQFPEPAKSLVKWGSGVRKNRGGISTFYPLSEHSGKNLSFLADVFCVCLNQPLFLGNKIEWMIFKFQFILFRSSYCWLLTCSLWVCPFIDQLVLPTLIYKSSPCSFSNCSVPQVTHHIWPTDGLVCCKCQLSPARS